jgi:thymidylate kinase
VDTLPFSTDMYIIFEGIDAAGKDVLRAEFEKRTGFRHNAITRLFASQLVYSAYYKRPLWMNQAARIEYIQDAQRFIRLHKPLTVFVTADDEVTRARMRTRGENPVEHPDPSVAKVLFRSMIRVLGVPDRLLLEIDTSNNPPLSTLAMMVESRVKTLEGK